MRPTATSPSQCPSSKYGSHERATPRRRHRVQGGAKPPAHGMWEHSGQLRVLLQRPAQASALSAPAGARGASRDAPRRDDDRTRVEAGSITFLIRFSIIIFSILKSIFMRTLNRRARRAVRVRNGGGLRLPTYAVSPRSPPSSYIHLEARGLPAATRMRHIIRRRRSSQVASSVHHAPHHAKWSRRHTLLSGVCMLFCLCVLESLCPRVFAAAAVFVNRGTRPALIWQGTVRGGLFSSLRSRHPP